MGTIHQLLKLQCSNKTKREEQETILMLQSNQAKMSKETVSLKLIK